MPDAPALDPPLNDETASATNTMLFVYLGSLCMFLFLTNIFNVKCHTSYEGTFFLSSEPQSSRTCVPSTLASTRHSSVPWGVSLRSVVTQIFSCNDIASIL